MLIQKEYCDTEKRMYATQIVLKNPNITMDVAEQMITNGYPTHNILCLLDVSDMYNCIKIRHNEILKLEQSIIELNELFIGTHAIIMEQGNKIDKIADKTKSAKNDCTTAEIQLTNAFKYVKKSKSKSKW